MDIEKIRAEFPVCENYHYFQSAGMSPMPLPVYEKILEGYRSLTDHGDIFFHKDIEKQEEMFGIIAGMLNCTKDDISMAESNSMAMSLTGMALKKKHNDFNIVSMEEEFPSNSVPLEYLDIEMRYVKHKDHRYHIEDILALCDENTLAVQTSYVQYGTGFRQDLYSLGAELEKRNILFIVNATQAFPFFPPDMKANNIDVLSISAHKWGFSGHIGTFYVTSPDFRKNYPSPVAGWLSVDVSQSDDFIHTAKNKDFDLWEDGRRYLFASANLKSRLGFSATLKFLQEYGIDNLRKHMLEISDYMINRLKELPCEIKSPNANHSERSAIVVFSMTGKNNSEIVEKLAEKKIIVALRDGGIRASVNIFTNKNDVDALINGIQGLI
jgi:selenocysteine lyase/cysteine desulfurase